MKRSSVFIAMMSMFLSFSLGAMRNADRRVMSVEMQDLQDADYPIVMVVSPKCENDRTPGPLFFKGNYNPIEEISIGKWQYDSMVVEQLLYPFPEKNNENKGSNESRWTYRDIKEKFIGHWMCDSNLSVMLVSIFNSTEGLLRTTKVKFNGNEKIIYLLDEKLIKKRDGDSNLDDLDYLIAQLSNYNKKDYGKINELRQLCIAEKNYILSDLVDKEVCWPESDLSSHEEMLKLLCERITLFDGEIDGLNKNSKNFLRQILFAGGALLFLLGIVYKVHLIKNS